MPSYPVTVSASYDAACAPARAREALETWAAAGDGRTFIVDGSIGPVRWTATADYQVDAASERAAEEVAIDRFTADTSQAGIGTPETVLAATGPLR